MHHTQDVCARCGVALNGAPSAHNGKNTPGLCEMCFLDEAQAVRDDVFAEALRYRWPTFHAGGHAEVETVAAMRKLPRDGVALARARGFLRFVTLHGDLCWIVTDDDRQNAQARKMDGKPWKDGVKGLSVRGSRGCWPLGTELVRQLPKDAVILWVEGGPDMLAACSVAALSGKADAVGVIAMLGASMRPLEETLAAFRGRRVRICRHADDVGARAARNWAVALYGAGAETDVWVPKWPHEDLNDAISDGVPAATLLEGLL